MSSFTVSRTPKGWRRARCGGVKLTFLLLSALLGGGMAVSSAQGLPIFDAHIHYSQPDWTVLTPDQVLAILDCAGVQHALVSSTPDDGTLKLYDKAPRRIVPFRIHQAGVGRKQQRRIGLDQPDRVEVHDVEKLRTALIGAL